MDELCYTVKYDSLNFKYADSKKNKDVTFYKFLDSEELFDKMKNNQIRYDDALNKQKLFLNKLNNVKIGGKNDEQKKVINNIENFYKSREEVFNFF